MLGLVRIIGLDPGLRHTGWGVIEAQGSKLSYVACGTVHSEVDAPLAFRLRQIYEQLTNVLEAYKPAEAAVEETFVNKDARATLKLGQARGVVMLVPALKGLVIAEYAPNMIKKSVVGVGHAEKDQVKHMVKMLLPRAEITTADAADALAVAICHAGYRTFKNFVQ